MADDVALSTCTTPAERVARAFGGDVQVVAALARQGLNVTPDTVRKWRSRREVGGGGGLVPSKYQAALLTDARDQRITLTAADIIGVAEAAP